jgi:hypothetical protein
MALRNEDREWLQLQIDKAIAKVFDSVKPQGWKKVFFWLREWGIAAAIIGVFAALIAIVTTLERHDPFTRLRDSFPCSAM